VPAALAVLTATGCSGGSSPASGNSATRTPAAATAGLTISPANGARDAAPGQGITVTTAHGKIDHVTVSALGEAVQAGPDGSTFVSPATLPPSHASPPLQTSRTGNDAAT
jgi:hypothetical protein